MQTANITRADSMVKVIKRRGTKVYMKTETGAYVRVTKKSACSFLCNRKSYAFGMVGRLQISSVESRSLYISRNPTFH
jgi:hypothetical protein